MSSKPGWASERPGLKTQKAKASVKATYLSVDTQLQTGFHLLEGPG